MRMFEAKKLTRHLPLLSILLGVALLGYVGFEYWTMFSTQQQLEQEFARQNETMRDAGLADQTKHVDDGLTKIMVPSIELDAMVVEGTSNKQLRLGPGRVLKSAKPGEVGNAVITAHRDTFFRHIYELKSGDEIKVQRGGKIYKYAVTGKKIVKPNDTWVMRNTDDAQLTLITCYPIYYIGPAPERLVVFSKMVGNEPATRDGSSVAAQSSAAAAGGH